MTRQYATISHTATSSPRMLLLVMLVLFLHGSALYADNWPTYRHDIQRSGYTDESLSPPLRIAWQWQTRRKPRPAWEETPALQDFWQGLYNNKSRVPIDNVFQLVAADGKVFLGSSNSDKLICLNAQDGSQVWVFFTEGPIRFAPTYADGKVYFGSDDGYVYCLDADDGTLVWKFNALGSDELMFANGRLISTCPVRTAVLVHNGIAYWGTGLFDGAQTGLRRHLCACNADNGTRLWQVTPSRPLQGYPLASAQNLYVPAGKTAPSVYKRTNGDYLGTIGQTRQGGSYVVLSNDNKLYIGPHYSSNGSYIAKYDIATRKPEQVAWGPGNYLVVTAEYSYYSTDTRIWKIRRSNKSVAWKKNNSFPYELILAGDVLFAGGDDMVAALSTSNGEPVWSAPVKGRVHGLAVANGALFVSTAEGSVYCFKEPLAGDLDSDGDVEFCDFSLFADQWLRTACGTCNGADIAADNENVDLADLDILIAHWMFHPSVNHE